MTARRDAPAATDGTGARRRLCRRTFLQFASAGIAGGLSTLLAACGGVLATSTPAAGAGTGGAGTAPPAPTPTVGGAAAARPASPAVVPVGSAASGQVSFIVWGDPAEKAAYESLVASFAQRQPRVAVGLTHIPSQNDYLKRLAADFAGGTPSDVILLNYRRYGAFAARGALEPVGPYLAGSAVLKPADFYPESLAAFTRDGQLVGVPQNVSSLVIYYNKGLFDRVGVAYPRAGWTWDDFLQAARALTRGTEQYGVGIEPSMIRLAPFVWQNGGDIVDDRQAPTRLTLDRPESAEATQWFVELQARHRVAPDAVQQSAEDDESRFLNGRTAMYFDSRRVVPTLREIKDFEWDAAPLPGQKARASILHSDAYFLTSASRNKPAAYAFVEYANSPEGQTFIARTGRTVPSLRAVAESPVFLEPAERPQSSRVFLDAIPVIRPTINVDTTEQIEGIVGNELKRAFYGQAPVAEAIATATGRTADLFRR
jgi:multiple sugar transport system substrate-binding protein